MMESLMAQLAEMRETVDSTQSGTQFWRIGADISKPDQTAVTICLADGDYNGEAMTAGDILFGDNSSGKFNIFFDKSLERLYVRLGTDFVAEWNSFGTALYGQASIDETQVSVTSGNVQLDRGGKNRVRIVAATGNFTIQTISEANGVELTLTNDTTFDMTLENNSGAPGAGYADVFTMDGSASITKTGYSIAKLMCVENISSPATYQWMLESWQG